jgi:hypothetical protein
MEHHSEVHRKRPATATTDLTRRAISYKINGPGTEVFYLSDAFSADLQGPNLLWMTRGNSYCGVPYLSYTTGHLTFSGDASPQSGLVWPDSRLTSGFMPPFLVQDPDRTQGDSRRSLPWRHSGRQDVSVTVRRDDSFERDPPLYARPGGWVRTRPSPKGRGSRWQRSLMAASLVMGTSCATV